MPTFLVVANKVHDVAKFQATYAKEVLPLINSYGAKYRVINPSPQVLEGGPDCEGATIVILEWPSSEAARKFWYSKEYQRVKQLRDGISEVRAWLVEGPWFDDNNQPSP